MLIGGIVLGLVLGLLAGGTLGNLAIDPSAQHLAALVAVILRYGTEILLSAHIAIVEALRLPLLSARVRVPPGRPVEEPHATRA